MSLIVIVALCSPTGRPDSVIWSRVAVMVAESPAAMVTAVVDSWIQPAEAEAVASIEVSVVFVRT